MLTLSAVFSADFERGGNAAKERNGPTANN